MRLDLTIDMDLVRDILFLPEIWSRCAEDSVDKDSFYPSSDSLAAWLLCIENDHIIGLILVQAETSVSIQVHPYLKADFRHKGRDMMTSLYDWVLENTSVEKVNAVIPTNHKKVINFSKRMGFLKEGLSRNSYRFNGKLYDRQMLGITRNEIEVFLHDQRN